MVALQRAVYACETVTDRIGELYKRSGLSGYKPGASVEDNIKNLVSMHVKNKGTMFEFFERVGESEGTKDGTSYTDDYWKLLEVWHRYLKTPDEQVQYRTWLEKAQSNINTYQKLKLESVCRGN